MIRVTALALAVSSCAHVYTPDHFEHAGMHTLRLYTGSKGQSLYTESFAKAANQLCHKGFDIIEQGFHVSTLPPEMDDNAHYAWVVRCRQ